MSSLVWVKLNSIELMMPIHGNSRSKASANCVVVRHLEVRIDRVDRTSVATLEVEHQRAGIRESADCCALNTGACFT